MRSLRLVLLAVGIAGASLTLAACGGGGGPGEKTLDLTIGDSVPLSGALAPFGPPGEKAADIAVNQVNQAIGAAGVDHSVKIVHEDNETNPQAAVSVARKMVDEGASCIAGAWASADTIPTARSVSIREGVLQISPASTSDELTGIEDNGLLNRTSPPDRFQGPTLAAIMDEDFGVQGKTINIGARNDAYGTGLAETFSNAWEGLGGKIGEQVIYDPEQPSYNSEAQQITSGNPDAILIIDFPETFAKVGPALARTPNWDPSKMWFTDGLASSDPGADPADLEGAHGTAPGTPEKDPATGAFDKLFAKSPPRDVKISAFDAQNFDAVVLCYLSAVAAGSTDGQDMADEVRDVSAPPGTKYTWQDLPNAIKALEDGDDIDYEGASGAVDMDDAGDSTAEVYDLYTFKGGELKIVGEHRVVLPEGEEAPSS
jgi:ABC-type branched-subunit amino acid transport system substrate-binding protein